VSVPASPFGDGLPEMGTFFLFPFWERAITGSCKWNGPADIRAMFNSVDFVADNRVIFDIGGDKFRLIARVSYKYRRVLVKFVGTHAQYDRINPETV
jgi:mRNA interferase HigB